MNKQIGFIGCGNMARAMIGGIVGSKLVEADHIMVSNRSQKALDDIQKYGVKTTLDNKAVASVSDILILAVKPHIYPDVIREIKKDVKEDVILVNIAAGVTLKETEGYFERRLKVVKAMPNTPSLVLQGMSGICPNDLLTQEELQEVIEIFESFGQAEIVSEKMMDAVTAVSGSAPAYVYLFIEAMADAAVLEGMPREQAYKFAAQTVLGAATMVLKTGEHPGKLKDQVCSPGGTTIEAVTMLEENGLRSAVISAMKACSQKSKAMTNK